MHILISYNDKIQVIEVKFKFDYILFKVTWSCCLLVKIINSTKDIFHALYAFKCTYLSMWSSSDVVNGAITVYSMCVMLIILKCHQWITFVNFYVTFTYSQLMASVFTIFKSWMCSLTQFYELISTMCRSHFELSVILVKFFSVFWTTNYKLNNLI